MQTKGSSLAAAVRFDPQRRAASPEMRGAVRAVIEAVDQHKAATESRQRGRGKKEAAWHLAIEAIVCNLAGLTLDPFGRPLAVPRSNGVMWSGTMYAEPVYGAHFLEALDTMADPVLGLVEDLQRGYKHPAPAKRRSKPGTQSKLRTSQPSTIRPGLSLSSFVDPARVTWDDFKRVPAREIIVLKEAPDADNDDERTKPIDHKGDTAQLRRWRKELGEINNLIAQAKFWLLPAAADSEEREPIDPTRRPLRRVFTGGTFDIEGGGGRMYDGFWIDMPRAERWTRLRIASKAHPEGEPIAIIDMRQFNPRAAYVHCLLKPPHGDLYDIREDGSCREGFKQLVNAMLSKPKPLTGQGWPDGLRDKFPPGTKLSDLIKEVQRIHAPIAHKFGIGFGARLAMIESTIMVDAVRLCFREGIIALPIHDAVVVARSEAECACDILYIAPHAGLEEFRARPKIELGP